MGKLGIIKPEKTIFTLEEVVEKFPEKKRTITQELVDYLNEANSDPAFDGDGFMNNLLTYKDVMLNGSASIKDFVNAMRFCAYLEACDDNATEAYKKARMDSPWVQERMNAKSGSKAYNELTHVASRYRKENKLVRQILTQTDMPLYLMFQGSRYRAVSVLEKEMLTAPFSKDRIAAADKLLSHVKPPDNQQIE